MRISVFFDFALPSKLAAAIQTINTAHALAMQGVAVDLLVRRLDESAERSLAFYGLTPTPRLHILSLGDTLAERRRWRPPPAPAGEDSRHFFIGRDESGLRWLQRVRRHFHTTTHRYVIEAHRTCFDRERPPAALWPLAAMRRRLGRMRLYRLEAHSYRRADGLIALTPGVLEAIEEQFGLACPTLILPGGVELDEAAAATGDEARDLDVVYVGKLARRKGVGELLQAMSDLPPRVVCTIVGGSTDEVKALTAEARRLGVAERVTFTGHVAPPAARACLRRARVGVCPLPAGVSAINDRFTFPMKLTDMMACGAAIVATDLPTVRRVVQHERTALLAPPNDPPALARSIQRLLDDRPLARRLATAAAEEVRQYAWPNRAARLLAFLETL